LRRIEVEVGRAVCTDSNVTHLLQATHDGDNSRKRQSLLQISTQHGSNFPSPFALKISSNESTSGVMDTPHHHPARMSGIVCLFVVFVVRVEFYLHPAIPLNPQVNPPPTHPWL